MKRLLAIIAGLGLAAGSLATGLSTAHADGVTTVLAASMTADKTELSGTDIGVLTVSVRMVDTSDNGVQSGGGCLCAEIQTVDASGNETSVDPQALNHRVVRLSLSTGSQYDGTWVGHAIVGAINAGDWQIQSVNAGTFTGPVAALTTTAPIAITGSHWPHLKVVMPQTPPPYGTSVVVHGTANWSDTGQPIAGLPLMWGGGLASARPDDLDGHVLSSPPSEPTTWVPFFAPTRTDADGNWSVTTRAALFAATINFGLNHLGLRYQWISHATAVGRTAHFIVTATVSGRRISGSVQPHPESSFVKLQLQQLANGHWSDVTTATASFSTGGYHFAVSSSGTYRVVAPSTLAAHDIEIYASATGARKVS